MAKKRYEVRFKMKPKSAKNFGSTSGTSIMAESETNAINEIKRQRPTQDIEIVSIKEK